MTCIAFRAGRFAADRQVTGEHKTPTNKIVAIDDEELGRIYIATAGKVTSGERFKTWVKRGRKGRPPSTSYIDCIVAIRAARTVEMWEVGEGVLARTPIARELAAIGSGARYALGAFTMGASARKAVLVASQHDQYTGQGVDTVRVW